MSEPKLISPMLDHFVMGGPISDHDGVRCCPAMPEDSDKRYIVKIISVPASQVQLEALLLTGACKSEADALSYFRAKCDEILEETEILKNLSSFEGFLPYESSQIVPMDNAVGYDVYLLSPYRKSLERHFRKYPMTHLAAVNLGLDMCAALAMARKQGYLYVDLKPDNIFISTDQEYRIGDLGFLKLDSLKYAALPSKYRSVYTAPEMLDDMATVNTTIDIFAAGLILYQAYNGGTLPFEGNAPAEVLPAPMYADYEMAEIIARACHPDPSQRWQSPLDMGQAIVAYMQRNDVNDVPIVPPKMDLDDVVTNPEEDEDSPVDPNHEVSPDQVCIAECFDQEDAADLEQIQALISEDPEDPGNLSFMDDMVSDDTAPDEHAAVGVDYMDLSGDVSTMLEQADDLIAHDTPDGVVAPDPIEVPVPKPVLTKRKSKVAEDDTEADQATRIAPVPVELKQQTNEEEEYEEENQVLNKKTGNKILSILLVAVLLAALIFGGYLFYTEFYLQPVNEFRLEGNEDELRVYVSSDTGSSDFIVVCTDTHGTTMRQPVENGVAVFNGLNPNTLYTIKVEIDGFGKLSGDYTQNYTTPVQTDITDFQAITGNESGSVILSFTVEGQDADTWSITYQAEGEPMITETFTGHMITVRGLTPGKTYSFELSSENDLYLTGTSVLEYTAVDPFFAEDVRVSEYGESHITVTWTIPENSNVAEWTVRCYSESGYDETVVTSDSYAKFEGTTTQDAYTIEVIASGMSSGSRCYITSNAVILSNISIAPVGENSLKLSWGTGDTAVSGNWMVLYSVDGSAQQEIIRSTSSSVVISPVVPGANYSFDISLENGSTVFGGTAEFKTGAAENFDAYNVSKDALLISMCKAPDASNWTYKDVDDSDYTTNFTSGQKVGLVMMVPSDYDDSEDSIAVMFVIRDANGVPVSWNSTSQTWDSMWQNRYCELTIPVMPTEVGNYTLDVYFNGQSAFYQTFNING